MRASQLFWTLAAWLLKAWLLQACIFGEPALGDCLSASRLTGVNMAGGEFNSSRLPGEYNRDYIYPRQSDLEFVAAQGANLIRLPFRWERLRPDLTQGLDSAELARLQSLASQAKSLGLCLLLDMHNYGAYYGTPLTSRFNLGDQAIDLQAAFVDTWRLIAKAFTQPDSVAFGLMNEPAHLGLHDWNLLARQTLTQLRRDGSSNWIMVGGGGWNGLHSWFNSSDGYSNADDLMDLRDPLGRMAIELHQYADSDYSGTSPSCQPPELFEPLFARVTDWAKANQQQLFLGEFGFAASAQCDPTFKQFLQLMKSSPWLGWSYWAGGRWWSASYPFALNTDLEAPSPQWAVLHPYFAQRPLPPTPGGATP